MKKKNTDKRI